MKVSSPSNLFALRALSPNSGASSPGRPADATDETPAERIKAWREARVGQSAMKSSPRQAALEKAAILKRRLEMLKAMLLFASPEAAKSIASQLKGIAGELAALGKSLGGGSSALATPSVALPSGETSGAADSDLAAAQTPTEQASTDDTGQTSETGDAGDLSGEDSADDEAQPGESTPKSDDSALRKAIAEAKRLLKELILRTKTKLQEGDAQARRDLQAAEKSLADLDSMTDAGLYTALGGLSADTIAAELSLAPTLSGASVDISA